MLLGRGGVALIHIKQKLVIIHAVDSDDRELCERNRVREICRCLDLGVGRIGVCPVGICVKASVNVEAPFIAVGLEAKEVVEIAGARVDRANLENRAVDYCRGEQVVGRVSSNTKVCKAQIDVLLAISG